MKSKVKYILWIVLASLFFIVGVPITINEAYKIGTGYLTLWNAADVFSYYGTILGAGATIIALVITISFTQKQIHRDSYLKSEHEKWSRTESAFADALNSINPMRPLMETMDTGFTDPSVAIKAIQKYQMTCRTATDQLNAYLNIIDYPKVKPILDTMNSFVDEIDQILQDMVKEYSRLSDFLNRGTAQRTIEMENKYPGFFPKEDLVLHERLLKDTSKIQPDEIKKVIAQLNEKIIEIYCSKYRSLLQLKGSTFEIINTEIQQKADSILFLWRKP